MELNEKMMKKGIDYPGVCIVYFCYDGKGNFVMSKRGKNCRDEIGTWDIGGGGLDVHDTVENTLKKEVKEEYTTDILEYEFLGFRDMHRVHEGQKTHWVALDFKCLVDASKVSNGEPHKFDEVKWFSFDNLPENMHPGNYMVFEKYKDKLK